MHSFRKFAAAVACLGVILGTASAEKADEKAKAPKDTKKAEQKDSKKGKEKDKKLSKSGKGEPSGEEAPKGKLSVPILKGHDALGLKIPYFNNDGKLQMIFNIGRASRLDDNRVTMNEMALETYDDEGQIETTIELPTSVLDLKTNVLSTDASVTITRSDFELSGRSMEFNTETRQGRLAGEVRMLIYNLQEETAPAEQ